MIAYPLRKYGPKIILAVVLLTRGRGRQSGGHVPGRLACQLKVNVTAR